MATAAGLTISRNVQEIPWVDPGPDFVGGAVIIAAAAVGLIGALALASGRTAPRGCLRDLMRFGSR